MKFQIDHLNGINQVIEDILRDIPVGEIIEIEYENEENLIMKFENGEKFRIFPDSEYEEMED